MLLRWRDHPGRLTRTDPRYRADAFARVKALHLGRLPALRAGRPIWIWGAGRHGRQLGRALQREGVALSGYVDIDAAKIGRTRRGCPVHAPGALTNAAPRPLVLAAVPVHGARALIRRRLNQLGYAEGRDYICCA